MAIGMEARIPITKAIIHTFEFTHTPGPNMGTYFHLDFLIATPVPYKELIMAY
jgi:hypothetical protein